jgi:hypothetical protein
MFMQSVGARNWVWGTWTVEAPRPGYARCKPAHAAAHVDQLGKGSMGKNVARRQSPRAAERGAAAALRAKQLRKHPAAARARSRRGARAAAVAGQQLLV